MNRIYKWDNLKLLLIFLVVLGHFAAQITSVSGAACSVYMFIYAFHMPLFLFVSGLFQKPMDAEHPLRFDKIFAYFAIGMLLKVFTYAVELIMEGHSSLSLIRTAGIPWFMFVLAVYPVLAYLCKDIKPVYVMGLLFLMGCISGCDSRINDAYCLSRLLVFAPFYFAGYYLTPEKVMHFINKPFLKIFAPIALLLWLLVCAEKLEFIYPYRTFLTARVPFAKIPIEGIGPVDRMVYYPLTILLCIAVTAIIPNRKIPHLSQMGTRTLQVYFWHKPMITLLYANIAWIQGWFNGLWKPVFLLLAVPVTLFLCLPCFAFPTEPILNCRRIPRKKQ